MLESFFLTEELFALTVGFGLRCCLLKLVFLFADGLFAVFCVVL